MSCKSQSEIPDYRQNLARGSAGHCDPAWKQSNSFFSVLMTSETKAVKSQYTVASSAVSDMVTPQIIRVAIEQVIRIAGTEGLSLFVRGC